MIMSDNTFSMLVEANALLKEGNYDTALAAFDAVLSFNPKNTIALFGKATCWYNKGSYDKSLEIAEKALEIDGDCIPGDIFEVIKDVANGGTPPAAPGEEYSSDDSVSDLCDDGFRYLRDNNIVKASKTFNRANKMDPNDPNPIVGQAYCSYNLGYHKKALEECNRALKLEYGIVDDDFLRKVKQKAENT